VEDIIDAIINSHFDLDFDYWKTNFELVKEITLQNDGGSVFWESERVVDIISEFVFKWEREGCKEEGLEEWANKFRQDKWTAARQFWDEMRRGMLDIIRAGMMEPIHHEHGFINKESK
jgi:glyceraldehyde-3-phosphate dehydrogenase (ferredoxin)